MEMGKNSGVEWCHHSHNLWWGCTKIKEGCRFCYAKTGAESFGFGDIWGPENDRHFFPDKHYLAPLRWNRSAEKRDVRELVFCGSMMDVFECHQNTVVKWKQHARRQELWDIISKTRSLDWLLLTKRLENVVEMVPIKWVKEGWPLNVWLGFSASTQAEFNESAEYLWEEMIHPSRGLKAPRTIFTSLEPLIEPINIKQMDGEILCDWVIAGGETGDARRRILTPGMVRPIRNDCKAAMIPFFFKQWGGLKPGGPAELDGQEHKEFPTHLEEELANWPIPGQIRMGL